METAKTKQTNWVEAYSLIYGDEKKPVKRYEKRLNELQTWDKPLAARDNDPGGMWAEWQAKVNALVFLISQNKLPQGRPRKEPSTTISFRVPATLAPEIQAKIKAFLSSNYTF